MLYNYRQRLYFLHFYNFIYLGPDHFATTIFSSCAWQVLSEFVGKVNIYLTLQTVVKEVISLYIFLRAGVLNWGWPGSRVGVSGVPLEYPTNESRIMIGDFCTERL